MNVKSTSSSRPSAAANKRKISASHFEPLESRRLQSVSVSGGTLFVSGDAYDNTISVIQGASGTTYATVNGVQKAVATSSFNSIYVSGAAGKDNVYVDHGVTPVRAFVYGGNDSVVTGSGNDSIWGAAGNDTIKSGYGNDRVDGGEHSDYIEGGEGHDDLYGDAGINLASSGNDYIFGQGGDDRIDGGFGADVIQGNSGFDTLWPNSSTLADKAYLYLYQTTTLSNSWDSNGNPLEGAGDRISADFEKVIGGYYTSTAVLSDGGPIWFQGGIETDYLLDKSPYSTFIGGLGEDYRFSNNVGVNLPYNDVAAKADGSSILFNRFDEGTDGTTFHEADSIKHGTEYVPHVRPMSGVDEQNGYVIMAQASEWLEYTVDAPTTGLYQLNIHGSSYFSSGGKMHVEVDGVNVSGSLTVPGLVNATYATWDAAKINLSAGRHVLRFAFDQNDSAGTVGDFESFRLTKLDTKISGTAFLDNDSDGVIDSGELKLSGRQVFLDTNKNGTLDTGEKSVMTDANGNYTFSGLAAGTYRVARVMPAGYRLTTPVLDLTVSNGTQLTGKNIGVTDKAKISGTVFNDLNGNRLKDSTEGGLSGWRVFLDKDNDGIWDAGEVSALTNSQGQWTLDNILTGNWTFRVIQQSGHSATTPTSFSQTFASGQVITGKLFGQQKIS